MYSLSEVKAKIIKATRLLYPRGRAFKMPYGGTLDKLHKALSISESQAYLDSVSILDSTIADNSNFTASDATDWEVRLGIAPSTGVVTLADRILAINRKYNHPGTIKARQHWRYIEAQLQAAGFNVFVYENIFSDGMGGFITKSPEQVLGTASGAAFHKTTVYHGTIFHGGTYKNMVANSVDEALDATFIVGSNYRSTFFISSNVIDVFADVSEARKNEFRQLILQLKPSQTVAYLFVNYI